MKKLAIITIFIIMISWFLYYISTNKKNIDFSNNKEDVNYWVSSWELINNTSETKAIPPVSQEQTRTK